VTLGEAVADQHGVERADRADRRGHLVHQRHHRLLGRVGDVEPVEAELDRRGEQPLETLPVDGGVGLVDHLVDVAQPLALGLALVHLRGQRRADTVPDQAGQPGPLLRGRHSPSLSGR
jgi:hypothetical protein